MDDSDSSVENEVGAEKHSSKVKDGDMEVSESNQTDISKPQKSQVAHCSSKRKVDPKKFKKGIVYLSFLPPGMDKRKLHALMSRFGEVGRIQLKEEKKTDFARKKKQVYTEAWVEFLKKRTAKQVAQMLNGTNMGGRKRNSFYDYLWHIKYLPSFKWVHLTERLTYEREVYKERMRTEINQAKKIADYFKESVDRSEHIKKKKAKNPGGEEKDWAFSNFFKQKDTLEAVQSKKKKKKKQPQSREDFLKNIFS